MFRRIFVLLTGCSVCLCVFFAGCAPQSNLALKFTPADTAMYRVKTEMIKDFRFEQPSLVKVKEEQTGTNVEVEFVQQIVNIDEEGNALAKVTIKNIKYLIKDKTGISFDFDSKREADKERRFAKLIGKSYEIRISSDGSVEVVDAAAIRQILTTGFDSNVAKSFLNDKVIKVRHEILALPEAGLKNPKKGQSWTKVKSGPAGLLVPKSFEKVYTINNIKKAGDRNIAVVSMTSGESGASAEGQEKSDTDLGPLTKLFDITEDFTGGMAFDLDSGQVTQYNENLVATYVAAEQKQDTDKGPDVLTMGLTYNISLELIE